jgi:hypothetical protein
VRDKLILCKSIDIVHKSESVSTQLQASKALIMLITRYPGLRCFFRQCKHIQSVEFYEENIVALWDPSGDRTTSDVKTLNFLRFAAACVTDADAAIMVEEAQQLWCCTDPTALLSVIERLLVASDCK